MLSGFIYHNSRGNSIRFITLTSSIGSADIQRHFRTLQKRIKRLTPLKLVQSGYINYNSLHYYYPNCKLGQHFDFEYLKVRTSEGNGVLHIVFKGEYIPFEWLCDQWDDIHNSPITDIKIVKKNKKMARYLVTQYMSGQDMFIRYSWSWGWVYRGFVGMWKFFIKYYHGNHIEMWNLHLTGHKLFFDEHVLKPPPNAGFVEMIQTFLTPDLFVDKHISDYYLDLILKCKWVTWSYE